MRQNGHGRPRCSRVRAVSARGMPWCLHCFTACEPAMQRRARAHSCNFPVLPRRRSAWRASDSGRPSQPCRRARRGDARAMGRLILGRPTARADHALASLLHPVLLIHWREARIGWRAARGSGLRAGRGCVGVRARQPASSLAAPLAPAAHISESRYVQLLICPCAGACVCCLRLVVTGLPASPHLQLCQPSRSCI